MNATLADVLTDEPNEAYHARSEVSASQLKSMNRGWRWFEAEHITKAIPRKESPSMRMGTAIHCSVLERDKFSEVYAVCPPECSDRRTKAHKEWASTVGNREVLTAAENDTIQACASAVDEHPVARRILTARGINERSFTFTDEGSGVPCRVRFDRLAGLAVCDLKTIDRLDDSSFAKAVVDYRYDLQAAHYLEGLRTITGELYTFVFIVVETQSPFRCRTYQFLSGDLQAADDRRAYLLDQYAKRIESGDWSDPNENELQTIELPSWFKRNVA